MEQIAAWKLSKMQVDFCRGFAQHNDLTRAIMEAGYKITNRWAVGTFKSKFMTDSRILGLIKIFRENPLLRTDVSRDAIINEVKKVAFSNISDYMVWGPGGVRLKGSAKIPLAARAAISEISETVNKDGGRTIKFKLHSKMTAIDKLKELEEEEAQRSKVKGKPGVDILNINMGNVRMVLSSPGTRKAIERICSQFFNMDLQLDPKLQRAIAEYTGEATPALRKKMQDPAAGADVSAAEFLRKMDGGDNIPQDNDIEMSGDEDGNFKPDPLRPVYGEGAFDLLDDLEFGGDPDLDPEKARLEEAAEFLQDFNEENEKSEELKGLTPEAKPKRKRKAGK
jgi:hypothetical protein